MRVPYPIERRNAAWRWRWEPTQWTVPRLLQ